jgi:hypothetical protein
MTYGPLTALTTPLPDGSTRYQVFTMAVDGSSDNGPVHWTGSFTQCYQRVYHSGAWELAEGAVTASHSTLIHRHKAAGRLRRRSSALSQAHHVVGLSRGAM